MDQNDAVKLLKGGLGGVRDWNEFRQKGGSIPDLSGVDLAGVDLQGTRSGPVRPPYGLIQSADLSGLRLDRASFLGANLSFVNSSQSRLGRVDFQYADVTGANFKNADLTDAALLWANLHRARFKQATMTRSVFGHNVITTDMSEAVGLEWTKHLGPSQVSADAPLNTAQILEVA